MSDATDLFGQTFDCACGRTHAIEPREVVYGPDALDRVPEVCRRATDGPRAAVLMDARTREAAGEAVVAALRRDGWRVTPLLVPDPEPGVSPVCDEATMEALDGQVGPADVFVPVGSGVVTDLGKWLAFDRDVPFVAFATAASMNGYASANVAPTIGRLKTLLRARPPAAIVADPKVLAEAPPELTASGFGDAIAKSVSAADWRLNHLLFGDYYCERAVGLIAEIEPLYLDRPEALRDRDPEAMEALFRALLLTGVAMTMAETSAPASGGEHLVSHTLDMTAPERGEEHDLHGRQVGVGTILAAALYERVLAVGSPEFQRPQTEVHREWWGPLAPAVEKAYAEKTERLRSARLKLPGCWDALRAELRPLLRPPAEIKDALRRAGAAHRAEDIGCTRGRVLSVLLHAHEMRPRFTVLDLARLVGVMPRAAGELVAEWV
jgi:glycerol-1-phosphate dehydrogenase [NAD(P)+]